MGDFPPRIAALLACHNRREKTVACLRALRAQAASIEVFLVDDGSGDGTAAAVRAEWPGATILQGDGNLFWCAGMRLAWAEAARTDPDYYLLLNDDTILFARALGSLLELVAEQETIAVGAVCAPGTRRWTYGGLQSDYSFPMPDHRPRPCRTMNANCALIPRVVYKKLGMFHHIYRHSMGDLDYGLAATRSGIAVVETPDFIAECPTNDVAGTWRDKSLPKGKRLEKLLSPKGLPPRDWFSYCLRNGGWLWPRYFFSPYFRILLGR